MKRANPTLIAALLSLVFLAQGQENTKANTVKLKRNFLSLEASISFNKLGTFTYERLLIDSKYFHLFGRVGVGFYSNFLIPSRWEYVRVSIPLGLNLLIGKTNHFAEIGFGGIYEYNYTTIFKVRNSLLPYGTVGYRYQFSNIPVFASVKYAVLPFGAVIFALGFRF